MVDSEFATKTIEPSRYGSKFYQLKYLVAVRPNTKYKHPASVHLSHIPPGMFVFIGLFKIVWEQCCKDRRNSREFTRVGCHIAQSAVFHLPSFSFSLVLRTILIISALSDLMHQFIEGLESISKRSTLYEFTECLLVIFLQECCGRIDKRWFLFETSRNVIEVINNN